MIQDPIRTLSVRHLTIKSATFDNQLTLVTTVDHIYKLDDTHVCEDYYLTRTSVYDHTLRDAYGDDYEASLLDEKRFHVSLSKSAVASFHKACREAYATHEKNQEIYDTLRV